MARFDGNESNRLLETREEWNERLKRTAFAAFEPPWRAAFPIHLLKTEENEHVEIHEVRGFVSDDVVGALKETQAVAAGNRRASG